jgi:hypothetical protein
MQFILTIDLERGVIESFDDVITAMQFTAGTLTDSTDAVQPGQDGELLDSAGDPIGNWVIREEHQCEFCGSKHLPIVAKLQADPDQMVCSACHLDPRVPTVAL